MSTKREKENERDVELLRAIARGDREAYAALYDRHGAILLGLLNRILKSRSEAEDVLQEVFLQVWLRAGDFDARRGGAFPWLALLARSRALDRLSTLGSRARWHAGETPDAARGALPDPADEASLAEEGRLLRQALGDIPSSERAVLMLAYFEGLSQSEIAARLAAPLGTVKSHARLGLARLRDRLHALRNGRGGE